MNKDILRALGFEKEVECIENGKCPLCNRPIRMEEFRDTLSIKEFKISGMCQKCQDKIWG
jgi:hypothetical protein